MPLAVRRRSSRVRSACGCTSRRRFPGHVVQIFLQPCRLLVGDDLDALLMPPIVDVLHHHDMNLAGVERVVGGAEEANVIFSI